MSNRSLKRKVLLMGKSGSGKTSMRSIIFANYLARETRRLGPTLGVENSNVRFLGQLILNLWDCGGQDHFITSYFESQRESIFRHVELLIYVFDIESTQFAQDAEYFLTCIQALTQANSQSHHRTNDGEIQHKPRVFCLIHKMDLIQSEADRHQIFAAKKREIEAKIGDSLNDIEFKCFATSIWDETLYKAWSSIVHSLIPNIETLEKYLHSFCDLLQASEVVLFEKATFLVISSCECDPHSDAHRYEKISNIIKQFKLSCSKMSANFQRMEMRNSRFTAFVDQLTSHTYIMAIQSNNQSNNQTIKPMISEAINMNLQAARPHFEAFLQQNLMY